MRNTGLEGAVLKISPPTCGAKKRERTCPITLKSESPWKSFRLARNARPSIFDLRHATLKVIGVLNNVSKSNAVCVNFQ